MYHRNSMAQWPMLWAEAETWPKHKFRKWGDAPTLPPHQSPGVAWVPDRRHKDNAALTFLPRKGLMGEGANSYGLLPPDQRHLMWSKLFTLLLSLSSVPCLARVHHHVQRLRHTGGKYVGSGQSPKSGPVLGRDLLAEIHHSFQWLPPPCSKKNSKIWSCIQTCRLDTKQVCQTTPKLRETCTHKYGWIFWKLSDIFIPKNIPKYTPTLRCG